MMDYDDNWAHLHIHLQPGFQHLNGLQVVGLLRWRKNNHGVGGSSDDFFRTDRQREFLRAFRAKLSSWDGIRRLPAMYRAYQGTIRTGTIRTNLSVLQLIAVALAARQIHPEVIPGKPAMIGGISYVICDWEQGRRLWQDALH